MSFEIDEKSFVREVIESSKPVLVYFWAPWCSVCHLMLPVVEKLQKDKDAALKLITLNADKNFKLANTYKITNLPTILLIDHGIVVEKLDYFNSREKLYFTLDKLVSTVVTTTIK